MPRHVAIIMDGNGRWAKQRHAAARGRPPQGRRGGARRSCAACLERGVEYLTLFAFSSENWRRPADEVSILMELFLRALEQEVAKLRRERHPLQGRRRHLALRPAHPRADRRRRGADRGQHAAHAHRRRQLRRALGHRAGGAALFRAQSRGAARRRRLAPEAIEPYPRDGLRAGARSVHPHRRRAAHLAISCSGSSPTPSSTSPTCCGRISTRAALDAAIASYRRARAPLRPHQRAAAGGRRVSAAGLARASADVHRCC